MPTQLLGQSPFQRRERRPREGRPACAARRGRARSSAGLLGECARESRTAREPDWRIVMTQNERPENAADIGLDVHVAERYFTQPAIDRRLPEHSREPRTAFALVESEMILDGDPAKNLATFV